MDPDAKKPKSKFIRTPYVKRTNEEKRRYQESRNLDRANKGLQPLPAKKKGNPKPKVTHQHTTQSDSDVARKAIKDLTGVIKYLNKHFDAHIQLMGAGGSNKQAVGQANRKLQANRDKKKKENQDWKSMTDSERATVIEGRHVKHLADLKRKHPENWQQVFDDENEKRAQKKADRDHDTTTPLGDELDEENADIAPEPSQQAETEPVYAPPAPAPYTDPGRYDYTQRSDKQIKGVPSEYAIA